jgi:hypothetical protein
MITSTPTTWEPTKSRRRPKRTRERSPRRTSSSPRRPTGTAWRPPMKTTTSPTRPTTSVGTGRAKMTVGRAGAGHPATRSHSRSATRTPRRPEVRSALAKTPAGPTTSQGRSRPRRDRSASRCNARRPRKTPNRVSSCHSSAGRYVRGQGLIRACGQGLIRARGQGLIRVLDPDCQVRLRANRSFLVELACVPVARKSGVRLRARRRSLPPPAAEHRSHRQD